MRKFLSIILALSMLFATSCGGGAPAPAAPESPAPSDTAPASSTAPAADESEFDKLDKVYIGCILPLTGAGAASGKFAKDAIDLWIEEYNAAGGILGKKVEVVIEDTQSTENGAANAYLKLAVRGDLSAIMGGQFSNQALATLPHVLEYKIPTINHGSSVRLTEAVAENPYTYQNRINDKGTGYSLADAMVNVLGGKKIALIHDTDAFGQGLADNAIAAMKEFGAEPALILSFATNEKQFAGYLSQIKDAGCDSIIMMAHPNEAALIQMSVKSAGMEDLIKLGSPDAGSSITISLSGDDANGWYSIADWVPTIETEPGKTFAENYRTRYGVESDMNCTSAYDQLTIFKAAIEKAGSQDPAAVQEAMLNLGEVQGTATMYSFNDEHIGATSQYLAINKDQVAQIVDLIIRGDFKNS